jgi:transposase
LAIASTPTAAAALSRARIAAALRRAGRQRGVDELAARLHAALRVPHLRQPPRVERAMGLHALTLLDMLNDACAAERLGEATAEAFREHPDYEVITSFPGLGETGGARVLAEIGDDRSRFADPRSLKAYAGSAPVTRASGRRVVITRRRIKNDRLATASWTWAFASLTHSPGARAHYDRRRAAGDRHSAALRHLSNRFLGQLHHCLATGKSYAEDAAWT